MRNYKDLLEGKADRDLPKSNLYLSGFGRDTNGNSVVKFNFAGSKGSSIQTNSPEFKSTYALKTTKIKDLSDEDLVKIEKEIIAYINKFGTKGQKASLKSY